MAFTDASVSAYMSAATAPMLRPQRHRLEASPVLRTYLTAVAMSTRSW